jgi:hypothetical protein
MKNLRRYLILVFTLIFFLSSNAVAFAAVLQDGTKSISELHLDEFLKEYGVPSEVLGKMSFGHKVTIYNELQNENEDVEFQFFTEEDAHFTGANPRFIPRSELTLSAAGFRSGSDYLIFPSFRWHTATELKNDTFAFTLDGNDWVVVPGTVQLNIWLHSRGGTFNYLIDRQSVSSFAGHGFRLVGQRAIPGDFYEGNAVFRATKRHDNARYDLWVSYAQDSSFSSNLGYSISFGVFSVSYSTNSTNLRNTYEILRWN